MALYTTLHLGLRLGLAAALRYPLALAAIHCSFADSSLISTPVVTLHYFLLLHSIQALVMES